MVSYIDWPVQFHEVYFLDNTSILIVYDQSVGVCFD